MSSDEETPSEEAEEAVEADAGVHAVAEAEQAEEGQVAAVYAPGLDPDLPDFGDLDPLSLTRDLPLKDEDDEPEEHYARSHPFQARVGTLEEQVDLLLATVEELEAKIRQLSDRSTNMHVEISSIRGQMNKWSQDTIMRELKHMRNMFDRVMNRSRVVGG